MIIDAHVNITHNGKWFNTPFDASIERLFEEMDENNIDKCLLISMPYATTNIFISNIIEKYPDKFRGLAQIDFSKNVKEQIDDIIKMGFSGIKIHPRIQNINIVNKEYDLFWRYINEAELPLLVCGYLQVSNKKLFIEDLVPTSYEGHIKKYNKVNFVLSHAGSHRVLDTYFLCRANPNFFTNISYSMNIFNGSSIMKDFKYLLENADQKVMFGSDFPEIKIKDAIESYNKLTNGLSKEKLANIDYKNANKIFWNNERKR